MLWQDNCADIQKDMWQSGSRKDILVTNIMSHAFYPLLCSDGSVRYVYVPFPSVEKDCNMGNDTNENPFILLQNNSTFKVIIMYDEL